MDEQRTVEMICAPLSSLGETAMKAPQFEVWFARLTLLNQPQRTRLQQALRPTAGLDQIITLIDRIRSAGRRCPRCDGASCHRHGLQ